MSLTHTHTDIYIQNINNSQTLFFFSCVCLYPMHNANASFFFFFFCAAFCCTCYLSRTFFFYCTDNGLFYYCSLLCYCWFHVEGLYLFPSSVFSALPVSVQSICLADSIRHGYLFVLCVCVRKAQNIE